MSRTEDIQAPRGISVVIPYYRGAKYIARALAGVRAALDRAGAENEIIVVDDSPNDAEVESLAAPFGVRLLRNETNRGIAATRNAGLAAARFSVLHFLDQDDEVELEFYSASLKQIARGCRGVVMNTRIILKGEPSHIHFRPTFPWVLRHLLRDRAALKHHVYVKSVGQLVITREILSPFLDIRPQGADDQFAFARLLRDQRGSLGYVGEPLLRYHLHELNYSHSADFDRSHAEGLRLYLDGEDDAEMRRYTLSQRAWGWLLRRLSLRAKS